MTYYSIHFTLNPKLRGSNDYIKDYKLHIPNDKLFWEDPKFIGSVHYEKINFEPYLLDIELFASSKINDLIADGGPISGKPVISGKLKSIIEKYRTTGMQFFNISIIKKGVAFNDYWILNMYEFNQEYIDFQNSIIIIRQKKEGGGTNPVKLEIKNKIEFNNCIDKAKEKLEGVTIEKLSINNIKEDFFMLKYVFGGMYYVSEKLKKEIEDAGCTGIEFQPSELSINEWYHDGHREKIYGKA